MPPDALAGGLQRGVPRPACQVGHGGVEVHSPDGMAGDLALLAHRSMGLVILIAPEVEVFGVLAPRPRFFVKVVRLTPALVHEVLGQSQVFVVPGRCGQLDQGQLDLLMAAVAAFLAFFRPEDRADVVRVAAHDVQQARLTGRLIMRDGGLDQMPGAVKFVVVPQVGPAPLGRDRREVGVQIPVRLLRPLQHSDDFIQQGVYLGVRVRRQAVRHRLHPLGDVRVPKNVLVGDARQRQRLHAPRRPALVILNRDRGLAVDAEALLPEAVINGDGLQRRGGEARGGNGHKKAPWSAGMKLSRLRNVFLL